MVKRTKKEEPQSGGWGSAPLQGEVLPPDTQAGNGNISDNPEDRRPNDEGWDEAEARQRSEEAQQPAPAEPEQPKAKKSRKKKGEEKPADDVPTAQGNVNKNHNGAEGGQLVSIVERIERLAEEKKTIADDMKEVMAEAKSSGYDTATIRRLLQRRKMGKDAVDEMDAILDLYESQVGFD